MSQEFFEAMLALDIALKPEQADYIRRQGHHAAEFKKPNAELEFGTRSGECYIWYCIADGGYSRFLWDWDRDRVDLSNVSIEPTKTRFKALVQERERVNQLVRAALTARGPKEPLDHCGACGQWIGGPVICCHHSHEQPCVTAARAAEIRELTALRARVEELTACSFPDSKDIAVVTLPNGERWACAGVVGAEIERLRARLEDMKNHHKVAVDGWTLEAQTVKQLEDEAHDLRARVAELEQQLDCSVAPEELRQWKARVAELEREVADAREAEQVWRNDCLRAEFDAAMRERK